MTFAIQPADKQFAAPEPSPRSYVTETGPPKSVSQAHAENMAAAYSPFGDPFIPALHGLLTSQADGSIAVIPSAGTQWSPTVTGDDAVQINLAFQYTTEVRLIGATYNIQSTINLPWNYRLRGMGRTTVLNYNPAVAGDCIRQQNPNVASGNFATQEQMSGIIEDLTVDGLNAPAGSAGIHQGDGLGYRIERVFIRNFTGSGGIGLHLDNNIWWTEKGWWGPLEISNCSTCILIEQTGGTNSFEYNYLQAHLYLASGQVGVQLQAGAQWDGPGGMFLSGNVQAGGGPFLVITGQTGGGAFSKIYDCPLFIRAETGNNAAVGATISFGTAGSNLIQQCTGFLVFAGVGTGSWSDAINTAGSLTNFRGRIFDNTSPGSGTPATSLLIQRQGQESVSTPGIPANGSALTVTTPEPVTIYLNANAVTWSGGTPAIQLNGTGIAPAGNIPGTTTYPVVFTANPGDTITLNYTAGTPSWFWKRITG